MVRASKKKSAGSRGKRETAKKAQAVDLCEERQKVKNVIGGKAEELVTAVVEDAVKKAAAQPMKMLFEMIGLFPESAEERKAAADDQSLAKTLLERLGLSDEPVLSEEEARDREELEESARALLTVAGDPVK
jgi:hypothetical protein